jgi:hypothetical protein
MSLTSKPWAYRVAVLAASAVLGLLVKPTAAAAAGQSAQEADGARLLKGAIDMHFHMDPPGPNTIPGNEQADIAKVRIAHARGLRALVIKDHNQPTSGLVYILRREVPDFLMYGGIVLNRPNGGINAAAVEFMATQIKGAPGKVVWMPAFDTEAEVKASTRPNRPFVSVMRAGEVLPEVKEVISLIAKHNLALASGHILAEEALMVFREARRQGVQHMIATHAMDLTGKMTIPQMQEAVKIGAILEFDYRNVFDDGGRRLDAIRTIGPEHCFISEFWTNKPGTTPREYAGLAGAGDWVAAMHKRGFTDRELDVMVKENPARLLGLPIR